MNASYKNWNLVLRPGSYRKRSISRIAFFLIGLPLIACMAQAGGITISLGQSAEIETLAGGGPNSDGLGTYSITLGNCAVNGGNTSCTLTGSFTGSTPGFTSGTYSLVTTYPGTGPTPLHGVQQSAGADLWYFFNISSTAVVTLTLNTAGGTVVVPIIAGGTFPDGAGIAFAFGSGTSCSGTSVANCTVSSVGTTAGAVITGRPTGLATFNQTSFNYYFSQLAFAGSWQMTLTYINYSPQTITCVTNFYRDSGSPLPVPFSGGTVTTRTDALAPGRSIHDQTVADLNATVSQGWAQATCDGPVQASLLYRLYQAGVAVGEAGVNAETSATTKFVTFAQTATGAAYANPSTTQSATLTLTAISSTGTRLGSSMITLGPLAHGAANIGPLLGLQTFTGFIEITSTLPIISLSLNAEAFPVFSSLPAGDLPSTTILVSP